MSSTKTLKQKSSSEKTVFCLFFKVLTAIDAWRSRLIGWAVPAWAQMIKRSSFVLQIPKVRQVRQETWTSAGWTSNRWRSSALVPLAPLSSRILSIRLYSLTAVFALISLRVRMPRRNQGDVFNIGRGPAVQTHRSFPARFWLSRLHMSPLWSFVASFVTFWWLKTRRQFRNAERQRNGSQKRTEHTSGHCCHPLTRPWLQLSLFLV